MWEQVDVSVIIVNRDTRELLRDCLASVYGDLLLAARGGEVIVVDNGSADGSVEMVETSFPHTRLIKNPGNEGYARGVNQGIDQSAGASILLLNSDTVVRPGAIEALLRAAGRASLGGAAPVLLNPDGTRQVSFWPSPWKMLLGNTFGLFRLGLLDDYHRWDHQHDRWVDWPSSAALLVPREVFARVGGFDERFFYGVDVDWAHRASRAGFRFLAVAGAAVVHHGRGSRQGDGHWGFVGGTHVQDLFFRKHYGLPGVLLFRGLLLVGGLTRLVGWEAAHLLRPSDRSRDQRLLFRRLIASAANPRIGVPLK